MTTPQSGIFALGTASHAYLEFDTRAHVARTDQDRVGKIFRRNMPYGTATEYGTMFVGFSAEQRQLSAMLESMAGLTDGVRDELTRYARPVTGAYYFVPSSESLRRHSGM